MQTVAKLLLVSRPISWLNTAYPFAAGYLVAGGRFDAMFFVGTLYFLIPYNLLMYGINDIFDYESDIRNPRKGGIEGAKEQKALHPAILWAILAIHVPFVVWFIVMGTPLSRFVFVLLLFFALAYSIKGLRFKEVPVLDSITSSLHFVGPLLMAFTLTTFPLASWPFVVAFFLWGLASHAFGAVQDIIPDREGNIRSIATQFGARLTVRLAALLYLASVALVGLQGGYAIAVGLTGLLYLANVVSFWSVTDATSAATNSGWRRFIWLNMIAGFVVTVSLLLLFIF